MRPLILLTCLLIFVPTEAKLRRLVATVVKLRGRVTQLAPGEHMARTIRMGDKVREDSSILTREGSFVRLQFDDGSLLNVGPDTKVVVKSMDKKGNGIINLLKGKMRSQVKENIEGDKKFFVRTRNAALGVRGTEFETLFNPENKVTSVLTYEGEVAVAMTEDSQNLGKTDLKNAKRIVRTYDNKIILEEEPSLVAINETKLEELLKNENTVVVKQGQFSQTVKKLKVQSQPVKISPVQLNALYGNREYLRKDDNKIKEASLDPSTERLRLVPKSQEAPPEGVFNPEKKLYAPKAGGILDIETGLYIAPSSDALFDQRNKIYYASNVGKVDKETGQYEPPLGLSLDANEGFVKKKFKKNTPKELLAKVEEDQKRLNRNLAQDVVIEKGTTKTVSGSFRPLSNREAISKNIASVSFESFTQTITQDNDTFLGNSREFESEEGRNIRLSLDYASGSRWQPTTFLVIRNYAIPENQLGSSISQVGDNMTSLGVGLKYSLSPRWNAFSQVALDQQYFLHHTNNGTSTSSQFIRVTIPKLQAGIRGALIRSGRFTLDSGFHLGVNIPRSTGDQDIDFGMGYGLDLSARYWVSRKYYLSLGYQLRYESIGVSGTSQVYEADVTRATNGIGLTLGTYF